MRTIYRYGIPIDDSEHKIDLSGPVVAAAVADAPWPAIEFWAEHETNAEQSPRFFIVVGTGHMIPGNAKHVFTCPRTPDGLVWHLMELA